MGGAAIQPGWIASSLSLLAMTPRATEYRVMQRPHLERPHVGTLKDSKHANLKELRFDADDGVWRVAFAFDPKRKAILLVAGDKSGKSEKAFYKRLIKKADKRFDDHLEELKSKSKRK